MESPPRNPFALNDNTNETFIDNNAAADDALPSFQSLQTFHQQNHQFNVNTPSATEALQGPIGEDKRSIRTNFDIDHNSHNDINDTNNPSLLAKILTWGGRCSMETLHPYFDIDTTDVRLRIKSSITYCKINGGFRENVLYNQNVRNLDEPDARNETQVDSQTQSGDETAVIRSTARNGPDLYGPVWITMTLVFFVAVTSNVSIYLHHSTKHSVLEEGGVAAEVEWDYDINQLLRATFILYSFSFGLPIVLGLVMRMGGVTSSSIRIVDLICLYGYSLVSYLPVTWICVVPIVWIQWTALGVASILSGMLVVNNVMGPILDSEVGSSGAQGKKGGLVMSVMGCHFVFFLVMKFAFYHHRF